jgi:streptogramin lyase
MAIDDSEGRRLPSIRGSVRATLVAGLRWINGLAAGPDGSLYYTEDNAVRRIDQRGVPGTDGPTLRGLAVAPDGVVFVAAAGCGAVLKITLRPDHDRPANRQPLVAACARSSRTAPLQPSPPSAQP